MRDRKLNPPTKAKIGRPPGSKRKTPLDDLNIRQTSYVKNKLQGKSDYQAARRAGYSDATAINCARNIEGPAGRRALMPIAKASKNEGLVGPVGFEPTTNRL